MSCMTHNSAQSHSKHYLPRLSVLIGVENDRKSNYLVLYLPTIHSDPPQETDLESVKQILTSS